MEQKRGIFDRLKVLFSTDVIIRSKDGDEIKVLDVNHIQNSGAIETNSMLDKYSRIYSPNTTSMMGAQLSTNYKYMRPFLYSDYDLMDGDAIVASALDIIADESTLKNEQGEVLQIRSNDEEVQKILYNLFYDVLNIEFNLWSWVRQMCKYGDFFLKLEIAEKYGVYNVIPYTAYHIEREEGYDRENPSSVKFLFSTEGLASGNSGYYSIPNTKDGKKPVFENYEMAHFRMIADTNYLPYGRSYLEPARRLYKQYCLDGNSRIWTPEGYTLIKDIKKDDEVYSLNIDTNKFETTKVKNQIQTGVKKIYELRTAHRTIKLTEEHPILTNNGDYKQVKDLTLKDKICIVNDLNHFDNKIPIIHSNEDDIYSRVNNLGKNYLSTKSKIKCKECNNYIKTFNSGAHLKIHNMNIEEYHNKWGKNSTSNITYRKQIIRGDYGIKLTTLKELLELSNLEFDENHYNYYFKEQQTPLIPDEIINKNINKIIRLFGFMLGDGWIDYNTSCFCFSLGDRLDKSMKYYDYLLEMGFNPNISYENTTSAQVSLCNKQLITIFENLDFKTGCHNKIVPKWVQNLPKELIEEFIQGFADADGCDISDTKYRLSTVNKNMMYDFKYLCQRVGYQVTNMEERMSSNSYTIGGITKMRKSPRTTSYSFSYYNINKEQENIIYEKIRKIEELDNQPVYDIEVESDNHNFISDGIVVHNCLMEDAMLIHRIVRAPEKRIFFMNVGSIPPNEVESFMQKTIGKMKRTPHMDNETGEYNLRYNMQNSMEDYYIPVRGNDTSTKIDTLPGLQWDGIQDVEYLRDKLFAALKVPKAFLQFEKDLSGKATLAAEDIRFGRTIDRIQRIILAELYKIALVHLYTQGYDKDELTNFELLMTTPSIIYDQERIALMKEKVELATTMMENKILPTDYIYHNIFHLSEEQSEEYRIQLIEDAKREFRLKQITEEGNDPKETGKSFGTPHDLASLYGVGRMQKDPGNVPAGYNKDLELGRPTIHASNSNKQDSAFGSDRLGKKGMESVEGGKKEYSTTSEGKSVRLKNQVLLESLEKTMSLFKKDVEEPTLLDDTLLKE